MALERFSKDRRTSPFLEECILNYKVVIKCISKTTTKKETFKL